MSKAAILSEISKIISSPFLFLAEQGRQDFLAELFLLEKQGWFFDDTPTYKEETSKIARKLAKSYDVPVTDGFDDDIDEPSIAYHRIKGMIMGESRYYFSTKEFVENLREAEENPMIVSHFLHVNSPGGDCWYLDKAWETVQGLKKPSVALIERVGASAAVYLFCGAGKIYAATPNETLGSIGTMVSFFNFKPYYEQLGIKCIEEYATKSDLKNKKVNDLIDGKPQQYIKEELDPLRQQFEAAVRKARTKAGQLEEKHPLFRGETYSTSTAIELGLIDGQKEMRDALTEAWELGQKYITKNNQAAHYLNHF